MPKIRIKGIGPIVDTGDIELSPVMLVIGRQSSGKSTFMKILCFCRWLEKRIMLDDVGMLRKYTHYNRFIKELKNFHRLDDIFFSKDSCISYDGDGVMIELTDITKNVKIKKKPSFKAVRYNTKISYVPSERNLASVIQNIDKTYRASDYDAIFNYLLEYQEAKQMYDFAHPLRMPFDDSINYYFDKASERDHVVLKSVGKEISPRFASSGVQSALPLSILVDYVSRQVGHTPNSSVTDITSLVAKLMLEKEKENITSDDVLRVSKLYQYSSAQLYIEELEENLFPESQFAMVRHVVKSIRQAQEHSVKGMQSYVVMTTHSPYVLTSLNVLMKAAQANELKGDIPLIFQDSIVPVNWFSAYCMTEEGKMEDIVDHEYKFIMGDYLDSLSDEISELSSTLDDVIYGIEA